MIRSANHVLILLAVAIPGSLLYFYFDPAYSKFFPPCPFFALTGLFCPGCGSQRAFHDLLHGHILSSAGHNLLFVLFLPLIILSAIMWLLDYFMPGRYSHPLVRSSVFAKVVLVSVLLFWMLRNIPLEPFSALAP